MAFGEAQCLKAWRGYVAFCWLTGILHFVILAFVIDAFFRAGEVSAWVFKDLGAEGAPIIQYTCVVFGLMMLVFGVGFFYVPDRARGKYEVHVVTLAMAAGTLILAPFAVPLLLNWFRPEMRDWVRARR